MLLFVVESDFDERGDTGIIPKSFFFKLFQKDGIDVFSILGDLFDCGSRKETAGGSWMLGADSIVVGVEKGEVLRMEQFVLRNEGLQNEVLKKPGGMCQVPFCGACLRHGLDHIILR